MRQRLIRGSDGPKGTHKTWGDILPVGNGLEPPNCDIRTRGVVLSQNTRYPPQYDVTCWRYLGVLPHRLRSSNGFGRPNQVMDRHHGINLITAITLHVV